MQLLSDKTSLQDLANSNQQEWIETNGLGGWAGSSLSGCHTRRYHGLLMAAIIPPTERMLLVSKLDETLILDGERFELGTNDFGDLISPRGFQFLSSFKKDLFPEWILDVAGVSIRKTITMVYGENTTLIRYEILAAPGPFTLQFLPLIAARGYHELQHAYNNIFWKVDFENGVFHNQPYSGAPDIFISIPDSEFQSVNKWYYHFNYLEEKNRGLDYVEDLFNHGLFSVNLRPGDILHVMLSTENPAGKDPVVLFDDEMKRKRALLSGEHDNLAGQLTQDKLFGQLTLAADQFVVKRDDLKTIIAGYHWFTDWSRDTMISLPGICLFTGRFEDARKIISVFAKSANMGMLPNRFQDNQQPPEYNNVDGTLWYFNAVYAYLQITKDSSFVLGEILPVLKDIIGWHVKGTRYHIHVDTDGLLYAGEAGQQLTWMDAKIGTWVVTARMGKPVEIQALWYNALKIFEELLTLNGELAQADMIHVKADLAAKSFGEKFWYAEGNYLYDVIDENGKPDTSLRPNQIFAVSLPFHLLQGEKAKSVLTVVRDKLYTPVGLRSLSPDDPNYKGQYGGDAFSRDSSYHQGPVWSWLLGPFIEAGLKTYGDEYKMEALAMIDAFSFHMNEAGIGSVSEIFDGDVPHHARGCIAQAWGVAETLRVIKTYSLFHAGS